MNPLTPDYVCYPPGPRDPVVDTILRPVPAPRPTLHVEVVRERIAGHITSSTARLATPAEVSRCERLHQSGQCDHSVFYDEAGWMYDLRRCGVCGGFISLI